MYIKDVEHSSRLQTIYQRLNKILGKNNKSIKWFKLGEQMEQKTILQRLEKYIASIIQPKTESVSSFIINCEYGMNNLKRVKLNDNEIHSSLGFKSLYQRIPLDEALAEMAQMEYFPQYTIKLIWNRYLNNAYTRSNSLSRLKKTSNYLS